MSGDERYRRTLDTAARITQLAQERGIELALIGAMALAVHGYVRATVDLDFASAVDPLQLEALAQAVRALGLVAEFNLPDAQDPLGGVLNVTGEDFNPIQIVNYLNPWNGLAPVGRDAVASALSIPGVASKVVDLPHLIALKLYAGGNKSRTDVIELLERNADANLGDLRAVCGRFGLGKALETILQELELA